MPTALITGISGQDGSYLAELLLARGWRIGGTVAPPSADAGAGEGSAAHEAGSNERPRIPSYMGTIASRLELHSVDLRDAVEIHRVVREIAPDVVYHLAARSGVGASWADPVGTAEATALGALHVLEAVRQEASAARLVMAGSCEVFGRALETPQRETTPPNPLSPYGVAKLFAHQMTALYRTKHALHASVAILFNHESPRRPLSFVSRKIVAGAVSIARGESTELLLGNLDAVRDWGFAGDYVEALRLMAEQESPEDYVIGTGEAHSVRDFCTRAFQHLGLDYRDHVRVSAEHLRPDDAPLLLADSARARARLRWLPTVSFTRLVELMVDAEQGLGTAGTADVSLVQH